MNNISKHISYNEATKSNTAIKRGIYNIPNAAEVQNMEAVAQEVFEPVREALGDKPLRLTSFFRSIALNREIGGSSSSQHCKGEAMDIDADGSHTTNKEVFMYIFENLCFDQLIWEFGDNQSPDWIHVSYKRNGDNRGQVLKAIKQEGKTRYIPYTG
jgi:hypothetical protein